METRPKVSVILPSFNVRNYIEECIESVLNQTLKEIEILCIDAGSTDGTRDILAEYAKRDSRIRLMDSEKKSCGYQENWGISVAKGEYIGFVETDDFIREDMYEKLYNVAKSNQLDYVKANHVEFVNIDSQNRYYENKVILNTVSLDRLYDTVINVSQHPEIMVRDYCMWNGIYSAEFLRDNNIRLNETPGAAYQDMGFELQTYVSAKRAMYLRDYFYHYRKDNLHASIKNPDGLKIIFNEFMFCKRYLKNAVQEDSKWWDSYYQRLCGDSINGRIMTLLESNDTLPENVSAILDCIAEEYEEALLNGHLNATFLPFGTVSLARMLVENREAYLAHWKGMRREQNYYMEYIVARSKAHKNTVIFGAGWSGKRLYSVFRRKWKVENVCAFCDNNEALWGSKVLGIEVISPQSAIEQFDDAMYIVTSDRFKYEIYRQLVKYNIKEQDIVFFRPTGQEMK